MIILYSEIRLRTDGSSIFIDRLEINNLKWGFNSFILLDGQKTNELIHTPHIDGFCSSLDGLRLMQRLD